MHRSTVEIINNSFLLLGMPSETTIAICSMIMGGVFELFPKLRVCFAHGGKYLRAGRLEDTQKSSVYNSLPQHTLVMGW